jgi:hypothetical protein
MNAHELKRKELMHLEAIVTQLEMLKSDEDLLSGCIIFSSRYWRSRVLAVRGSNADPDIEARTRRLLERLSALKGD